MPCPESRGEEMRRRDFITVLGGAAATWPLMAHAQHIARVLTVGILWHGGSIEEEAIYLTQIQQGLQALGYVEGRNITLANTFADEQYERFNSNAVELVRRKVDVLVAVRLPAALAAQRATNIIPIVFILVADPVATKLVASLARPGGNITGLSQLSVDLLAKRLELFKETVSPLSEIALLVNPSDSITTQRTVEQARIAAERLGLTIRPIEARQPDQIERAFSSIQVSVSGMIVEPDGLFFRERKRIAELALKRKIPTFVFNSTMVEDGGLMAYGASIPAIFRRSAAYVIRFSKVRNPANCRSNFRPSLSSPSISRPPTRSVLPSRLRSLPVPIRWLSEAGRLPVLARLGPAKMSAIRSLSGDKRTCRGHCEIDAFDPTRT
jgi:putative tryptophan/tyrosine transport system substrate-binding protein